MNEYRPTLMEILQPRHFQGNPKRAEATRTVLQPEIDKFEQFEAEMAAGKLMMPQRAPNRAAAPSGC